MSTELPDSLAAVFRQYPDKPVYVIGKGASLEALPEGFQPDGLILNINDSERLIQGDIAIATEPWVGAHLEEHPPSASLYLCNTQQNLPNELLLDPVPEDLARDTLVMRRLEEESLFAEPVGLVTAVKICKRLSQFRQKPVAVYFLGFEFDAGETFHKGPVKTEGDARIGAVKIQSQENLFIQLKHFFAHKGYGELLHVGTKPYSSCNMAGFLGEVEDLPRLPVNIPNSWEEAQHSRVLVVAEFTNNHLGDHQRLKRMVRLARNAGADLIKVQKRDVESFYSKDQLDSYYWSPFGNTLGDYRKGVELTHEGFAALDEECKRNRMGWFASILDLPSYRFLEPFGERIIKLPSTISNHREYHEQIARHHNGGLVVSTGMTDMAYEKHVMDSFGKKSPLFLLQCTSAYPAPIEACQISVVRHYRVLAEKHPNLIPGFSSHDPGSTGSMMAVAAGARMIEKHVSLGKVDWIHFDKVAMDLESGEFARFVKDIRTAERYCGTESKLIQSSEHHKYEVAK
jgi:sialic acid synthase SpsE